MIELRISSRTDFLGGAWFVWRPSDRGVIHVSNLWGCLSWLKTWGDALGGRRTFTYLPDAVGVDSGVWTDRVTEPRGEDYPGERS